MNEWGLTARLFDASHRGMVGSAIWRELGRQGFSRLIGRTRSELDLLDQRAAREFFQPERPEFVFLDAAKVGGNLANDQRTTDFFYENLVIETNLIQDAFAAGVRKLLFLGSSCIYSTLAPQTSLEDCLLTGPLEPTNQWYAIAKIAGIKRRQHECDFISAMLTILYGPNDNYDLETSHVFPALILKFYEAKTSGKSRVTCWGKGSPLREFLQADDLAAASVYLIEPYSRSSFLTRVPVLKSPPGTSRNRWEWWSDLKAALAGTSPSRTAPPRRLLDRSRIFALGAKLQIALKEGIRRTYQDFGSQFQ